jgi:CubicO group peptidase (beta-lactamase class C family)
MEKIDHYIRRRMRQTGTPGVSLAVVQNGRLIKSAGYGMADRKKEIPATAQTVYSLASVGKQFTAAAVMLLKQDGLIQLHDPIRKYLRKTPPAWAGITIWHLLSHTSGIRDYLGGSCRLAFRRDYSNTALVEAFGRARLLFKPGTAWDYTNTGYALLGFLIEKVTGKKWFDFLEDRIFVPLGMDSTVLQSQANDLPEGMLAQGYSRSGNRLVRDSTRLSATFFRTADGSVMSSVLDVAKWERALNTGGILSAASRAEMWRPAWANAAGKGHDYAYGWIIRDAGHGRCIWHDGNWAGFTSCICRFVDAQLTFILLANAEDAWGDGVLDNFKAGRAIAAMYEPLLKKC